MDECHITLFDPWFRRGIRDLLLGTMEPVSTSTLRENSHKDRQFVHKSNVGNISKLIKMDTNPSHTCSAICTTRRLSAANRCIHKSISRSNTPSQPSNLLIYRENGRHTRRTKLYLIEGRSNKPKVGNLYLSNRINRSAIPRPHQPRQVINEERSFLNASEIITCKPREPNKPLTNAWSR